MFAQAHLFQSQEFQELAACHLLQTVVGISADHAKELLKKIGGIQKLAQASAETVALMPGIGSKRAAKIKALTQWAVLLNQVKVAEQIQVHSPIDIANMFVIEMSLLEREELRVIILDTKNQVRYIDTLYQGSVNSAVIRISEIFRSAIINNGVSIVIVHNHPSGDPTPSPEDVRVTEQIYEMGEALDIKVLDHLVIGGNRFVSLKERGLGFSGGGIP